MRGFMVLLRFVGRDAGLATDREAELIATIRSIAIAVPPGREAIPIAVRAGGFSPRCRANVRLAMSRSRSRSVR
jgi:hypothetical protein